MNEPKRIEHMIKFMGDNLSEWEEGFVRSVEAQFKRKGTLTDDQYDKLEQVFEGSEG